jgi:hypothetical protein
VETIHSQPPKNEAQTVRINPAVRQAHFSC